MRLAYLVDIFKQLNINNLKLQGKNKDLTQVIQDQNSFLRKLVFWKAMFEDKFEVKVFGANYDLEGFEGLVEYIQDNEDIEEDEIKEMTIEIAEHLTNLEKQFKKWFPEDEFSKSDVSLVRNPFKFPLNELPPAKKLTLELISC